jgi:hypothetical protein
VHEEHGEYYDEAEPCDSPAEDQGTTDEQEDESESDNDDDA